MCQRTGEERGCSKEANKVICERELSHCWRLWAFQILVWQRGCLSKAFSSAQLIACLRQNGERYFYNTSGNFLMRLSSLLALWLTAEEISLKRKSERCWSTKKMEWRKIAFSLFGELWLRSRRLLVLCHDGWLYLYWWQLSWQLHHKWFDQFQQLPPQQCVCVVSSACDRLEITPMWRRAKRCQAH